MFRRNEAHALQLPEALTVREKNSHKKDFGHIFVLAGSFGMSGAAALTAKAVLRCGAGLVTMGLPKSIVPVVAAHTMEAMALPLAETAEGFLATGALETIKNFLKTVDVLLIGPGLSKASQTQEVIRKVILESRIPTIIDADAINAFIGHLDKFKIGISCLPSEESVLRIMTPHPGEFARILGISVNDVQRQRQELATRFAKEYNIVVVLKGFETVVANPDGVIYINHTGNSGMSTAGSGDVLTGIIAALIGQGLNSFNAAKFGVYLHGLAADIAVEQTTQIGLIASDIIDYLPQALKEAS